MAVRALLALLAIAYASAQSDSTWVEVSQASNEVEPDVEQRYTPELVTELQAAKDDALLLYTEYSARSGAELKIFIRGLAGFTNETLSGVEGVVLDRSPSSCRELLQQRLKKIEYDAHRAASFSAENHHKFFLGHMIVFRMHLNKSEDYIKKCHRVIRTCGTSCETTPRMIRWRRQALEEISRVRDDMQHSRKSYHDLLIHARRKLNHLKRQADHRAQEAVTSFKMCVDPR